MRDPNPNVSQNTGDNNNTNNQGGGDGGNNQGATKWYETSIPKEMHDHIKGYESPEAMVKDFVDTKGKLPKVPGKIEDYKISLDGLDIPKESHENAAKLYAGWRETALNMQLTQAQFDALIKGHANMTANQRRVFQENLKKDQDSLKKEWGNEYDTNLDKAEKVLAAVFEDEDVEYFKKSGLSDNPRFVKALWRLSSKVSEDTFVKNTNKGKDGEIERDPVTGVPMLNYPSMKNK